jgi:hypothetical protein
VYVCVCVCVLQCVCLLGVVLHECVCVCVFICYRTLHQGPSRLALSGTVCVWGYSSVTVRACVCVCVCVWEGLLGIMLHKFVCAFAITRCTKVGRDSLYQVSVCVGHSSITVRACV